MAGLNETETEMEVAVELEDGLLKIDVVDLISPELTRLIDIIDRRGYSIDKLLLDNYSSQYENYLELDSRNVFRHFFQNEYEAEKEFTRAALQYYWKDIDLIIHYLYDKKPC